MKNKIKIIVTGGAGYIGSHTIVSLYNSGYMPVIIDNLSNSSENNLKGINEILSDEIKWYNTDCTDFHLMNKIFESEKDILGCIHFAAFKSVEDSILNPEKYFTNNIKSLTVLLQCMTKHKINNIIFSSSCAVYGLPEKLPVLEDTSLNKPLSPYAESKQKCEEILLNHSCNSISLRYFNPIGNHNSCLIGDCSSDNANSLVPIIAEVAAGIREKIIINGNDYNTPDGTCVRDYIHVEDLASAHVNSLKFIFNNKGKHVFNVGTGKGNSVLEVITSFEKVNKIKVNYELGGRRLGDIVEIYANCDLINTQLSWFHKNTLEQALIDAWKWQIEKKY